MPEAEEPWIAQLRCPRCGGRCAPAEVLRCDTCGFGYPRIGGMPVLVAQPHAMIDEWRYRSAEFRASMEGTRSRIIADLATKPLHARTRARLQRLVDGLAAHKESLTALLEEAGVVAAKREAPATEGVPGEGSVTSYFHQIHRDWGWDAEGSLENHAAAAVVVEALAGTPPLGSTLVVGPGACRLATDVHTRCGGSTTFAIDINPVPMIVARRVLAGERVRLLELPLAPRDLEHVCVERELRLTTPVRPGFVPLFADAFAPPFADGTFDTVFTPWFIDQVPSDLAQYLPVVHRMLRPGGRLLNHGPLIYHPNHTELPARYAPDEVLALVEAAGFSIVTARTDRLTYMQSPACTRGRSELVSTFVAVRGDAPVAADAADPSPAWLDDPALPVPRFAGLAEYRAPHPLFATVISLIDDARSAGAIAEVMVREYNLPREAALPGVLSCLREIWRATR